MCRCVGYPVRLGRGEGLLTPKYGPCVVFEAFPRRLAEAWDLPPLAIPTGSSSWRWSAEGTKNPDTALGMLSLRRFHRPAGEEEKGRPALGQISPTFG